MERATVTGSQGLVFAQRRPSHSGDYTLHGHQVRVLKYRPLPRSTRKPFRLDIKDVVAPDVYERILATGELSFHLNGDIGGIGNSVPQQLVAAGMEADLAKATDNGSTPAFLYVAGDCVYYNGEPDKYYGQFYAPYEYYTAPIFAVPGNHDGENVQGQTSLAAFIANFCAKPPPVRSGDAGDSHRTAMIQPNVYWTLVTPVVNIVGLYSNVPEGGDIRAPQTTWLANELKTLPADVPLLVAMHHPVFSADNYHSGSTAMKETIEAAAEAAGRFPDMVIAGHVHDYQRLTHQHDGTQRPYLITGAGGYPNLHGIRKVNGEKMIAPVVFTDKDNDQVTLNAYSDDHHGFLRVDVTAETFTGHYYQVPRPQDPYSKGNQLVDYFEYHWPTRQVMTNSL